MARHSAVNALSGKDVVITGGSKGLGRVCAEQLLARGSRVFVLSRSVGQLQDLLEQHPDRLHWHATDIADRSAVERAFANIAQQSEALHGLVLNAVTATPRALDDMTESDIVGALMVNVAGPLYCLQLAAPLLSGGRVIFVSSETVARPYPMLSLYAGVKAAVETIFKGLRHELHRERGISLTVLRSGLLGGTSFTEHWDAELSDRFFKLVVESGFLSTSGEPMSPLQVAKGIIYLLEMDSEAAVNEMDIRSASAY
ncbi:MAG: SDR family NAD(P)-dependent oxidoreductase [Gammaproteobacteria bacterium]|nr:SDR family NAD(P)-dependent oxidoreductase [Gammaproteobacteria bacterium]